MQVAVDGTPQLSTGAVYAAAPFQMRSEPKRRNTMEGTEVELREAQKDGVAEDRPSIFLSLNPQVIIPSNSHILSPPFLSEFDLR